jgi:hypothetical protein
MREKRGRKTVAAALTAAPSQKIHTLISNPKLFSPLLKPNRGANAQGQARGRAGNPNANKANQAGGGRRGRSRTRRGGNNSNGRGIES